MIKFKSHSTRLFPKGRGADQYEVSGIAARCDWVVLSDVVEPRVHLKKYAQDRPKSVFLSLRAPFDALEFFADAVLPQIDGPFVLLSGSEDVTLPLQTDLRWRAFNEKEAKIIQSILDCEHVIAWFVENLDSLNHHKFQPLPLGMVYPDGRSGLEAAPSVSKLSDRLPRAMIGHRLRQGDQWAVRKRVSDMANRHWSKFCTVLKDEISEDRYCQLMSEHAFVICVEGGGYDPSPKAWQALLHGAIPIMLDTPTAQGYDDLPVIRVPRWSPEIISEDLLEHWQREKARFLDAQGRRAQIIERLGEDYWWRKVVSFLP